jgi:hypothetical protein
MTRPFLIRLAQMLLGYLLAALAAASVVSAILGVLTAVTMGSGAPILSQIGNAAGTFLALTLFASVFIFFAALPVWIPAAAYAEWRSVRSLPAHLFFGALASVPYIVAKWSTEPNLALLCIVSVLGGCAGGFAYWRAAGRNAGIWRQVLQPPAPLLADGTLK